jgi:hypothetical protein
MKALAGDKHCAYHRHIISIKHAQKSTVEDRGIIYKRSHLCYSNSVYVWL